LQEEIGERFTMSSVWAAPILTGDLNMLLSDVIATVRSATTPNHDLWLYLSGAAEELALDTDCDLAVPSEDGETDVEILPEGFAGRGLWSALDYQTVEFSVLCPSHHFESIKNKPCPFTD